jgi:hypothetical protein
MPSAAQDEQFALDRDQFLSTLVAGTSDYYYYTLLARLHSGDTNLEPEYSKFVALVGTYNQEVKELETRRRLLLGGDKKDFYQWVQQEVGHVQSASKTTVPGSEVKKKKKIFFLN